MLGAAADHDHRPLRPLQDFRCRLDLLRGWRWRRRDRGGRERAHEFDAGHHVPRHLDRHRAGPSRQHLPERFVNDPGCVGRALDPRRPFQQAAQRAELVRQFVQVAAAAVEELRRHLAGNAEDRGAATHRGAERGGGVQHAGAGHDGEHAGPPGRAGVAERHVATGLLVPRADRCNAVAASLQRVEQRIELRAGKPEQRVDAVDDQGLDDRVTAGHRRAFGHVRRSSAAPAQASTTRPVAARRHVGSLECAKEGGNQAALSPSAGDSLGFGTALNPTFWLWWTQDVRLR